MLVHLTCVFPWCTRPARAEPDEHDPDSTNRVPFAKVRHSCSCNASLCRRHHRAKTHGRWTYTALERGTYVWTSPHGYQYLRGKPTGTSRRQPRPTSPTRRTPVTGPPTHPPDPGTHPRIRAPTRRIPAPTRRTADPTAPHPAEPPPGGGIGMLGPARTGSRRARPATGPGAARQLNRLGPFDHSEDRRARPSPQPGLDRLGPGGPGAANSAAPTRSTQPGDRHALTRQQTKPRQARLGRSRSNDHRAPRARPRLVAWSDDLRCLGRPARGGSGHLAGPDGLARDGFGKPHQRAYVLARELGRSERSPHGVTAAPAADNFRTQA